MTREEAIKWMEETIQDAEGLLDKCSPALKEEVLEQNEVFKIAISALRSTPQPGNPLTLDQLREMDGQPVWIVEYPDWGHWELSEDANDYIVDRNLNFYGMKHDDPDGRYGLHKLGWLAYSYPPAHIDRSGWISVKERLPDDEKDGETVLAVVSGKPHKNITLHHAIMTAEYFPGEGWVVNEYPEWENPTITHWMPLPEPPEEGVNVNKENQYVELASHAIGLDHKKPYTRHGKKFYKPYRNYFSTAKGCSDYEYWDVMEASGYAKSRETERGGKFFWLTRSGLDWLGEQLGIHIYDEED